MSDPYGLLGLPRAASLRQIKAAHRALAKRYHPDSPTADARLFLRVQEAYQLLADPLRRREWDARHVPAPMRADEPAPAARAQRNAGPPATRRRRATVQPPPDAASRSYTWSATEVPWWEEGRESARRARRQAGQQRGPDGDPGGAPDGTPGGGPDGTPGGASPGRPEFDVYSRSSGAAWSSAARAYFRRADADLPRRGSFHHQGTQPLTAARARVAAEEEARRRPAAAPEPAASAGPARTRRSAPAGVAYDAEGITTVRAAARERALAAHWPSLWQRLRVAALAWLPIAVLVAFGGPLAAGCADGPGACPQEMGIAQGVLSTAALALLVALPRVAYIGAMAAAGVIVSSGAALLLAWLAGVRPPQAASLPGWAVIGGAILLGAAWVVAGTWLLTDRRRLPWVGPPGGPAPGPAR